MIAAISSLSRKQFQSIEFILRLTLPKSFSKSFPSLLTISTAMESYLPVFAHGEVIRGFGRGSKELGIPTANFPDAVVDGLPEQIETGIFFGWAKVDESPVHPMVVSIGEWIHDVTEVSMLE